MVAWYQALGIRGYKHRSFTRRKGHIHLCAGHDGAPLCCPKCKGTDIRRRGTVPRMWRSPPIGANTVSVTADVPRVECRSCQQTLTAHVSFAEPGKGYTRAFEKSVLVLLGAMTVKDVAAWIGTSQWTVRQIEKRWLIKHFSRPRLKHLRHIAIDEISIRKGHRYVTLVLDLDSGAVVFVGDGKGQKALEPFWKRLRASHAKVRAVAMDMSQAYILAVTKNLKKATIIFDWFHIVKLLNEKLTQLRRELYREATDMLQKKVLKGIRWLLLKRPDKLDESRNEHERLREALDLNESLSQAYYLKEELPLIFEEPNKRSAGRYLTDWIKRAHATGIRVLQKFANTLSAWRAGILAWFDYPISTGPLEGTNNKIKTLKRQAYGFRDLQYFKLKILALHLSRYELI